MAAPSRGLYIFVSICCFMVIPLGLLAPKVGPKLIDAWKFRKLGRPLAERGRVVGYLWAGAGANSRRLDLAGKTVQEWPAGDCNWSAQLLANDNLLLAGAPGRPGLCELAPDGKVVWSAQPEISGGQVYDQVRLTNGNTLVSLTYSSADGVRELNRDGKVVWSCACPGAQSVQRLANGNTLIGSNGGGGPGFVREVTPDGKVAWEKTDGLGNVAHARRLANGNTLVTDWNNGCVVELDRAGREVWRYDCQSPMSAERLPDGRTLVAHLSPNNELLLVAPDGKAETLALERAGGKAQPIYAGR
jgi:hypothetical protein